MKNLTLTLLALALAGGSIFAADPEAKPKEKLVEELMWEKALAENAKEADALYSQYQKALAEATGKVVKALESNIKDLNNPQKFSSLTMKQRAAAIEALEAKIKDAKKGAVGEAVVARRNVDALGDPIKSIFKGSLKDKRLITFLQNNPMWKIGQQNDLSFNCKDMTITISIGGGKPYTNIFTVKGDMIFWGDHRIDFSQFDGEKCIFKWTGVSPDDMTIKK